VFHVRFRERRGVRFPRATRQHRLFSSITQTWRGTPLTNRLAVAELIASTTTKTGLIVRCELDSRIYPKGITVADDAMASINIKGDVFHPGSRPGAHSEALIVRRRLR
jgi:hypothetical protein